MKKFIELTQFVSLCFGAICLLCMLGAEPSGSEESYYEYQHMSNVGWFLIWAFCISLIVFIVTTIIRYHNAVNEK